MRSLGLLLSVFLLTPSAGAAPAPEPWLAGAQLGFGTGVAPRVGGRIALFAERFRLREPSVRLALVLQPNGGEVRGVTLHRTHYVLRVELCSPGLGTTTLEWRVCGAADAGVVATRVEAVADLRDSAPWGAVAVHSRLRQWLGSRFAVEGEVGGLFPLSRYAIVGDGVEYHRDVPGLAVTVGLATLFD